MNSSVKKSWKPGRKGKMNGTYISPRLRAGREATVERPSEYGGNMLDAEFTVNPDDNMVIALLEGIPKEELEKIESSEDL